MAKKKKLPLIKLYRITSYNVCYTKLLRKYEYVSEAELVFKREKDGKAKFVKYIAALLKKAQEKGEIGKIEDIEMLAYCLHVFIMGIYKDFLINVNEDSPKEHWVNLIELFFYKNFSI